MPSILMATVVDRAEKTLQDETNVRWSASELLSYGNDGQKHIVLVKPDAYTKNENLILVEGTKQTIPATAVRLMRAVRNMGTDGSTPGDVIRWADLETLDNTRPSWHTDTASATVKNVLADKNNPRNFYVTPPQPASGFGYIEIIYSASPADATIDGVDGESTDSTITLDDIYFDPIYFYILFKAHSKEVSTSNKEKAMNYYNLMLQSLGLKTQGEVTADKAKSS